MDTFLSRVAEHVLTHYSHRLDVLTIVFPNKRAGLYLRNELPAKAGKTIWLPQIVSIEEAFSMWSGFHQADPLSIIFDLLAIHLSEQKDSDENMNFFAGYAMQMARDFDEIAHYQVNASELFNYLTETKALEMWHADGSSLTAYEKNYLSFFKSLSPYYNSLTERMTQNRVANTGTIAQKLANTPTEELGKILHNKKIIFAGFNALTPAEEKIVVRLCDEGIAEILWDLDTYYVKKNTFGMHEAGNYVRNFAHKHRHLQKYWIKEALLLQPKKVHIIGVPGNIGQAKAMGFYLKNSHHQTGSQADTAVVLADERLLIPVLNSIPQELGKFNVTMGLPFIYSSVYQLITGVFELSINTYKSNDTTFYSLKSLSPLLLHESYSQLLAQNVIIELRQIHKSLISDGSTMVKPNRILELMSSVSDQSKAFLDLILTNVEQSATKALKQVSDILLWILEHKIANNQNNNDNLVANQFNIGHRLINRLQLLLSGKDLFIDLKGMLKFITQIAPSYSVGFYGEPLEHMQIMGLLETRNLDFRCIHLLSANEGILPQEKGYQSLIPFDIRRSFGLPTYIDKQSVYAFHFFRMLQQTEEIYIYYNTEPDNLGGGEMSRFVMQLKYELARLNPSIFIQEELYTHQIPAQGINQSISIEKNENVLQLLHNRAEKGISPTSLSRYIECPLKFFLQDVLQIKEQENANEAIGMNVLGTVLHSALEYLHHPYLGTVLNKAAVSAMEKSTQTALMQAFSKEFKGGFYQEGRNKLAFIVAKEFVRKTLAWETALIESKNATLTILHQEIPLNAEIQCADDTFKIKGTIDRIDQYNNEIRIIDYKTGNVEAKDLEVKDWEELLTHGKAKALQLAVYQYLYLKNHSNSTPPISGIFSLRKASEGLLNVTFPESLSIADRLLHIESVIQAIFIKMFDNNQPILQTEEENNCKFCPFTQLCQRNAFSYD